MPQEVHPKILANLTAVLHHCLPGKLVCNQLSVPMFSQGINSHPLSRHYTILHCLHQITTLPFPTLHPLCITIPKHLSFPITLSFPTKRDRPCILLSWTSVLPHQKLLEINNSILSWFPHTINYPYTTLILPSFHGHNTSHQCCSCSSKNSPLDSSY